MNTLDDKLKPIIDRAFQSLNNSDTPYERR